PVVISQDNSVPNVLVGQAGAYRLQVVFIDANGNDVLCTNNWAEIIINESIVNLSESGTCGNKTITSNIIGDWEVSYDGGITFVNFTDVNGVHTGNSIEVDKSGTYRLTEGSCGGQKTIDVTVHPYPVVKIDQASPYKICESDAVLTATVISTDAITSVTPSEWVQIGVTNQYEYKGIIKDGVSYFITVETATGCDDSDNITPTIYEDPELYLSNYDFCEGDQVDLHIDNPEANVTYEWIRIITVFGFDFETPMPPNGISKIDAIKPSKVGTYKIKVKATDSSKPASCNSNSETFYINIHPIPVVDLDDDHIICTSVNYELDAGNSGDKPNTLYSWFFNGLGTGSNTQKHLADKAGTYKVEVTKFGCSSDDEVTIFKTNDNNFFGADRTLCIGDKIELDANPLISVPNVNFTWEFVDDATSSTSIILNGTGPGFDKLKLNNLQISNSGKYILTAHDPFTGCDYVEEFVLKVIDINDIDIDPQYAKCSNSDLEISINNPVAQVIYTWEVVALDGITVIHSETTTGTQTFKFNNAWDFNYTYRVSARLPNGCQSGHIIFDIYDGFVADFALELNQKNCDDDTNVSAKLTDPNMEAVTWQWFHKVNGIWEEYDSPILATTPKVITISAETTDA
ncbi:MAG: hypothetical protein KAH32_08630, partial [Chlamydiia bacterium]|nr:hypothetical protein [Chlamydiia bacterium]